MHEQRGDDAAEDDRREEAAEPLAGEQEVGVVEEDVQDEEGVDEAAEDAVVAVDVLVGGAEEVGVWVGGFEGEEVVDWQLGDGDDAEALGDVKVVFERGVLVRWYWYRERV